MREPKSYTREVLKNVLPRYCRGKTVDVGAGRAKYKNYIKKYAESYMTVDDLSSDYQFDAKETKPDVISSVFNMPFEDGSFDTVICTEVLEHVEDPFALMKEISRILKKGGHAIISSVWIAAYHKEPKDYWRFSPDTYQMLCDKYGLELVELHRQGGIFTTILYLIRRNIDLNTVFLKKVRLALGRINIVFELIAEQLDKLFVTEDAAGHLIVARKK
ncbi:MAG: class I SAM-dependent methyltransferase [Candidatus Paceibacterota bacterium]|jgi:SAM-dependent methyltransferase